MILALPKTATPQMWHDAFTTAFTDDKFRLSVRAIWVCREVEEALYKHALSKSDKKTTLKERLEDEKKKREWEHENGGITARYVFWGIPIFISKILQLEVGDEFYALIC